MTKEPIILDMDPGIDDAVALSIALTHSEFDLKLLTGVAGNVSVDKTTANLIKLVEFFNRTDIPVAKGAAAPLKKAFKDASYIHGASGMPGYDFPEPVYQPLAQDAISAMAEVLSNASEPITIVATGAYTNIALLLQQYPKLKSKIKRFVLMGGSLSGGNVSSVAEFNIFTDPDAAKIVFESGVDITMIGLDVTLKALLSNQTIADVASMGTVGKMISGVMTAYNDVEATGKPMHDVNTILYLLHPEFFTLKDFMVYVITDGPAIGGTIADTQDRWSNGQLNAHVAIDIDAKAFENWFIEEIPKMNAYRG
ncbi:ribonucleoside hydrolase RihC [Weissella diestrammenae]|uniref:Ribonucleoside hydrolase RihC n=1 Tax=Weissella diestrammenae TaxID=1162633 RepID=A0A7G9T7E4_9LACO|nr:ribonucleoside hydrolase RihC [Weissella diestrammenae]MCM0582034.1 ribonucleoside hydrolase RihC [Weissella diestrammenae]QNN76019.1 ribonucleoside hydrolase RihC [Weissella diestrammenae]